MHKEMKSHKIEQVQEFRGTKSEEYKIEKVQEFNYKNSGALYKRTRKKFNKYTKFRGTLQTVHFERFQPSVLVRFHEVHPLVLLSTGRGCVNLQEHPVVGPDDESGLVEISEISDCQRIQEEYS